MTITPKILTVLISAVTNVVEGLLLLRIALRLLSASQSAPFVRWVMETTEPLLTPFLGMFPSPQLTSGVVIEFSAIFALMVYAFIGYALAELIAALSMVGEHRSSGSNK